MSILTKRQQQLFELIQNHVKTTGVSPSFREMMLGLGLSSPGSIYKLVKSLRQKGVLTHFPKKWRSCSLNDTRGKAVSSVEKTTSIPFLGHVARGKRIELFAKEQTIIIPARITKDDKPIYGFHVKDDSFRDERISKDDVLILKSTPYPEDGEISLVNIFDKGLYIGKYFRERNGARLEAFSENIQGKYNTVIASFRNDKAQVLGVILALFRSYTTQASELLQ